jgi:hypothetical protein
MTEFLNTLFWTGVVFCGIVGVTLLMAWLLPEVRNALAKWEDE